MNRSLLFASLLGLLATFPGDDTLTWRVAKGTTLLRSLESKGRLELQSVSLKIDGNDQDTGPMVELAIAQQSSCEYHDVLEAVESSRPQKLLRHFTKLSATRVQSVKLPEQEEREEKAEETSDLEGKSVVFVRDDSTWIAKWAGDEKADDALLECLTAEVEFSAFLPGKAVEADEAWDLEAANFLNFMRPLGSLSWTTKGEDSSLGRQHDVRLDKSIEGKGTATYRGTREEHGVKVAVIAASAELTQHYSEEADGGKSGPIKTIIRMSHKLEGEILWDTVGGFARSASLFGTSEVAQTEQGSIEKPDGKHEAEQVFSFAGKISFKMRTEPKS